jgi:2,3-bisphosphoglycerate-independent phosphoglycerate mutase
MKNTPTILLILDGYGIAPKSPGNAIELANKPNIDKLSNDYARGVLEASGHAVGLPHGEDGNSEVGHINIGAGRVVMQSMVRINNSIIDGSFFINEALLKAVDHVKKNKSDLHLVGMIGLGSVHSYIDHLYALLQFCKKNNVENLYLHLITDGRDSPPRSCQAIALQIEKELNILGVGRIATILGRYYAMDRDLRWERTEVAYRSLTEVYGDQSLTSDEVFVNNYQSNTTDEFIKPTIIGPNPANTRIKNNDAVIFFNFRIDRPRQLTKAFVLNDFETSAVGSRDFDHGHSDSPKIETDTTPFRRQVVISNLLFVTMTDYETGLPVEVCYPRMEVQNTLGQIIDHAGLRQLRLAESEKERFVTYYFDGARMLDMKNEETIIVPSPDVATYDLKPEMSTNVICERLIEKLRNKQFDFAMVNIACPDMVAHTGNTPASVKAIEATDKAIGLISDEVLKCGGWLVITADHGNAEELLGKDGSTDTEHSNNPVPLIVVSDKTRNYGEITSGVLADVAPTVLQILGIEQPEVMTGSPLLKVS